MPTVAASAAAAPAGLADAAIDPASIRAPELTQQGLDHPSSPNPATGAPGQGHPVVPGQAPSRGATLKEIVQRRGVPDVAAPAPVASGALWRRLDLRPPVQAQTLGDTAEHNHERVHAAAEAGAATPTRELPYRDQLEASLGRDLSSVRAHVGGDAEASARAMGAEAYARGDDIALPERASLHTVAHEVTHVLQQRSGAVQLAGGVGAAGDRYEVEADEVANAIVRGDRVNLATGGGAGVAVQRREDDRDGGDEVADLPAGFEVLVNATLDMNVPEGDLELAQTRAKLLRAQFRALHPPHRRTLLARLESPRKKDTLAALFGGKLSTPERGRLLAILRDEAPAATEEAEPAAAEAAAAPGGPAAATPGGTEEVILQSSDPAVDGRAVTDVGAELHAKAANYGRFPAQQQEYASYNLKNEKRILDDHDGIIGGAINLFNDADAPNPERWRKAVVDWGVVQAQLQAVLTMQPTPTSINKMGELAEKGLAGWDAAMAQTSQYSDEFLRYLEGFSRAAKAVHAGVELTAEIAMAGAIACAVVLTGPAILAVGGQLATSVGATGAAAVAIKGTTALVGAGVVGAGFKGTTQAGTQVLVETGEAIYEMGAKGKSLDQAAAGFDWSAVGDKGWHGVKTGFIDGVMAQGGFAIEAVANKLVGKVATKFLGPYVGRLYAQVLRKSAERAASAGLAGGVTGALDAGTRAAVDGRSLPQIFDAMQMGGALGFGLGTIFGGLFGAVSETRAARAAAAGDVAPTHTPDVPAAAPAAQPASGAPRLDPERFQVSSKAMLDGTMTKVRLQDATTGKEYLFKPNAPDMPLALRAVDAGMTPDTIANRAKASEVAAHHFEIDSPSVQIVEYDGQVGSLQEWRSSKDTLSLRQMEDRHPDLYARVTASPEYAKLRADLDTFDYVVNNLDRNDGNLLLTLDDSGNVVGLAAIDNDLTFTKGVDRFLDTGTWARGLPEQYSREMVSKLRVIAADPEGMRKALASYLSSEEIEASITRVRRILDDVDAKTAARGEAAVFFEGTDSSSADRIEVDAANRTPGRAPEEAVVGENTDDRVRGINRNKPALETETQSLDGVVLQNDIRRMSSEARHVIRQLEANGWVRVDEIAPDDLAEVSKWFGKEIAVAQSPAGALRVVLGQRDGIIEGQILADEIFIAHTHPVMTTTKSDFRIDIANAGKHVEAVVDWSGLVTYFDKTGIKNPISPAGYVEPLANYRAAFMNDQGKIVGFARIDIIDTPGGTKIKVKP
jgi:hypothetical protein